MNSSSSTKVVRNTLKSLLVKFLAKLDKLEDINRKESKNLSSMLELLLKLICFDMDTYNSLFSGIILILPGIFESSFTNKWQSYEERLWKNIGINFAILKFKLQSLWAGPRYFPVRWQWSITLSIPKGFSQIEQVLLLFCISNSVEVRKFMGSIFLNN